MPAEDIPPRDLVQAAERSFAIIRAFGQHRQTLTQSQVADATGLSRATARRFLQSMEALGYVGRDGRDYYLRPRVLDLGYAYLSSMTLWDVAKAQMELLVQQVQESSSASVLDGTDIIFTVRVPTKRIMSVQVEIGTRFPAHATSMGRVLLADLPSAALDGYFSKVVPQQLTARSVTSEQELRVILKTVASQGWCLLDEELEQGVRSLAVPLHDKQGAVIAAMNVCAHASRVSAERLHDEFLPPAPAGSGHGRSPHLQQSLIDSPDSCRGAVSARGRPPAAPACWRRRRAGRRLPGPQDAGAYRYGAQLGKNIREIMRARQIAHQLSRTRMYQPGRGGLALLQGAEQSLSPGMPDHGEELLAVGPGAGLGCGPAYRYGDLDQHGAASRHLGGTGHGRVQLTIGGDRHEDRGRAGIRGLGGIGSCRPGEVGAERLPHVREKSEPPLREQRGQPYRPGPVRSVRARHPGQQVRTDPARVSDQARDRRRCLRAEQAEQRSQVICRRPGQRRLPPPRPGQLQAAGQPGHLARGCGIRSPVDHHAQGEQPARSPRRRSQFRRRHRLWPAAGSCPYAFAHGPEC